MAGLKASSCLSPVVSEVTKFMLRDTVHAFGSFVSYDVIFFFKIFMSGLMDFIRRNEMVKAGSAAASFKLANGPESGLTIKYDAPIY